MPANPENGRVFIMSKEEGRPVVGSIAVFSCQGERIASRPTNSTCLDSGEWTSPPPECLEPCRVPHVAHGTIGKYVRRYFRGFFYEEIPLGTRVEDNQQLYLRCAHGVQGSDNQETEVICNKGKWSHELLCQAAGDVPSTSAPLSTPLTSTMESSPNIPTTTAKFTSPSTTPTSGTLELTSQVDNDEVKPDEVVTQHSPAEECFCEYLVEDGRIIAHADGKRLEFGDRVRKGSSVLFRCLYEGYDRFHGQREIACNDCQPWHSSEIPSCITPRRGDAVILLNNDVTVSPNGDIEISKRQGLNLTCAAVETAVYPRWRAPRVRGISFTQSRIEREAYGDVIYVSHLEIRDAAYDMEGRYECSIEGENGSIINIKITDPNLRCPEFPEDDAVIITYEMERREGSNATFSCSNKGQELIGKPKLTCLRNGEWSDSPPRCSGPRCKQLKASDLLRIHYAGDREVGSLATFHCTHRGKRIGVSHTRCLENGKWADPTPTCEGYARCSRFPDSPYLRVNYSRRGYAGSIATFSCTPSSKVLVGSSKSVCQMNGTWSNPPPSCEGSSCSLVDLSLVTSDAVEPHVTDVIADSMPYGSEVKLKCRDNSIISGNSMAVCKESGSWELGNYQCVLGCELHIDPSSHLLAQPVKDSYRFGDFVFLSCPVGKKMSVAVERLMCLGEFWSDSLPYCQE